MMCTKYLMAIVCILHVRSNRTTTATEVPLQRRIIGGEVCTQKAHSFVVVIFGSTLCGGTMITFQWVLTAAHCVYQESIRREQTWLKCGFDASKRDDPQVRRVKKAVLHDQFSRIAMDDPYTPELRYDIALVQARSPFVRARHITVATLPSPGFAGNCSWGMALGVGQTKYPNQEGRSILREVFNRPLMCVDVRIVSLNACADTWRNYVVDDTILCTMDERGEKDACKGDSGGPLMCKGMIIGVISSGQGCAMAHAAATYIKVERNLDFSTKTMMETSKSKSSERVADDVNDCDKNGTNLLWLYMASGAIVLALK